jgi:prepilin peptidase CpaA
MNPSSTTPGLDTGHLVALSALAAVLTIAAFTEVKDRRIPNWVTLAGLGVGLLIGYFPGGISLGASLGGFLIGFGFLYLFYMFGGMGGGDVKLMGAVGALLGYPLIKSAVVYTALVGGCMAFVKLAWSPGLWSGIRSFFWDRDQDAAAEPADNDPEQTEDAPAGLGSVPYGFAIICGCLLTIFLTGR